MHFFYALGAGTWRSYRSAYGSARIHPTVFYEAIAARLAEILARELEPAHADPVDLRGRRQSRCGRMAGRTPRLNERTAALGVRESAQVLELVRSLPERGISVILISHNMDHVAQVAHPAVVLRQGRVAGSMVPTRENVSRLVWMIMGVGLAGETI
jgi:ABC-type hemin transport system ATPase subunit